MARNCYCKSNKDFNEEDYIDNTPLPEGFNDDNSFNEDDYVENTPLPEGFNDDNSFNEDDYVENTPLPEGFNDDHSFNEDDYIDNTPLPEGFNDDNSFNEDDYIDNTPLPEGFNDDNSFNEDDYIDNTALPDGINDDRSFNEDDYIDNTPLPEGFNDDHSFNEDDYIENTPIPEGFNDDRSFNEDDNIDNTSPPRGVYNARNVSGSQSAGSSRSVAERGRRARTQSPRSTRPSRAVKQRVASRGPNRRTFTDNWQVGPVIPRSPQKIEPFGRDGAPQDRQLNTRQVARSYDPLSRTILSPSNIDNVIIRRHAGMVQNMNAMMNNLQQRTVLPEAGFDVQNRLRRNGSPPTNRAPAWYPYGPQSM